MLAPYLLPELKERFPQNPLQPLKKDGCYLSLNCRGLICFKDALRFTSPTSLSKYLLQNNIAEKKEIYPYSKFANIEEIRAQIEFPAYEDFYSELKQENVSMEAYREAKKLYDDRCSKPANHPEKWNNFEDWMVYYCELDCKPFARAINESFKRFHENFGIDPSWVVSLPALAQKCMFRSFDPDSPLCYSFRSVNCDKKDGKPCNDCAKCEENGFRNLFRDNLFGGLVNVFHRMTAINDPDQPEVARLLPNGDPVRSLYFFDFNSLYLKAQDMSFPGSPGIHWYKHADRKGPFSKRTMTSGVSLEQVQWLNYLQEMSPDILQADGSRAKIHHAYFRGEIDFDGWKPDGYACVDGRNVFFEYLGCFFHPNCPNSCPTSRKTQNEIDERYERKRAYLSSRGKLVEIRGCEWNSKRKHFRNLPTPDMPLICNAFGSEREIIEGLRDGSLHGFVECDIHTPEAVLEDILPLNFPPLISRQDITPEMVDDYMKQRCEAREIKIERSTLIQTYSREKFLIYAPLARFYLRLGLKITKVYKFIQYTECFPLQPFVEKITKGRIAAARAKNKGQELAFKLVGNSSYGKLGERVDRYRDTKLVTDDKLVKMSASPLFKDFINLDQENGEHDLVEVSSLRRKTLDEKPVCMSKAIVSNSKQIFLEFVYDCLFKFLKPGSFRLNYCDTDSLSIGKC